MKSERLHVTLPPAVAAKLKKLAAERHVPASSLAALAIERLVADLEFTAEARRLETLLRAVLYGVGEVIDQEDSRGVARRLVNQAAARMRGGDP